MRLLRAIVTAVAVIGTVPLPAQQAPFWISPAEARALEQRLALPVSAFYDAPTPLPAGRPGDLLRAEDFDGYSFPFPYAQGPAELGMRAVRILYRSRALDGTAVPASGVVLVPYGDSPRGGWPVVVWAHGTSGVGRPLAPSLMKDLFYSWEGVLQWVMLGYAVVAPDYAGLGTAVPHQYLLPPAQAHDVLHAVPAARTAVPQLGPRWVVVGHSQGGGAAVGVAELQAGIRDPGYLGAVAIAAVGDVEPFIEQIAATPNAGYAAFVAAGIKSVDPAFRYTDFLSAAAAALMPVVQDGGWYVTLATYADRVPVGTMLRPDWKANASYRRYRELSTLGRRRAHRPVLLIQGLADATIPTRSTDALYARMRRQGAAVEYRKYPGLDHDPVVFGSFRDQVRWVAARFAVSAARAPGGE
jgi:alpha-beta hydrolase superfamily lysophospholipase